MANWHYVGNYGQLGPISEEQIAELVQVGGITRDTLVWCEGMPEWQKAGTVPALLSLFPQLPPARSGVPPTTPDLSRIPPPFHGPPTAITPMAGARSRLAAGLFQLFLPGVGRLYTGYIGIGVAQMILGIVTCGIGHIWSFVDGIIYLSGGVPTDAEGRPLTD